MLPNRQSMGLTLQEEPTQKFDGGCYARRGQGGKMREGGWLEFSDWLETSLDAFGLDAPLYARCVVSILRNTDGAGAVGDDSIMDTSSSLPHSIWGLRRLSQNQNQDTNMDKAKTGSVVQLGSFWQTGNARQRVDSDGGYQSEEEVKTKALLDCLNCAELEQKQLEMFVAKVLYRYDELTRKASTSSSAGGVCIQNDSIDSGVCPSPAESHQNYDEAFPPLLDKSMTPVEHHDEEEEVDQDEDEELIDDDNEITDDAALLCQSAPFTTEWSVRSAVEIYRDRLAKSCEEEEKLFNPKEKNSRQPHFVIPKCPTSSIRGSLKVGSCPTRFEFGFSGGPGLRLSNLECFFCLQPSNHEASLPLSAPPVGQYPKFRYNSSATNEPSLSTSAGTDNASVNMFDAPKFILHIINDDRKSYPRSPIKMELDPSMAQWSTAELQDSPEMGSYFEFCLPKTQSSFEEARQRSLNELKTNVEVGNNSPATRLPICSSTHFLPILANQTSVEEDSECDTQDSIREELFPRPAEGNYFLNLGPATPPSRPLHAVEHWSSRPNYELYRPLALRPTQNEDFSDNTVIFGASEAEELISFEEDDEESTFEQSDFVGCMSPAEFEREQNVQDEQEQRLEKVKPLWPTSRHISYTDIWQPTSPIRSAPAKMELQNEAVFIGSEEEEENNGKKPKISCPNIEMEDEQEDDVLIRYATNISLISQLGVAL